MYMDNSADRVILKAMQALELGHYDKFEEQLAELERLSHYANCFPTWQGMHNLTHVMRGLTTQILLDNLHKEKPTFRFVAL